MAYLKTDPFGRCEDHVGCGSSFVPLPLFCWDLWNFKGVGRHCTKRSQCSGFDTMRKEYRKRLPSTHTTAFAFIPSSSFVFPKPSSSLS